MSEASSQENDEERKSDPAGFLSEALGNSVTVKLNSGVIFTGELQSVDGYMNIALEEAKEIIHGQVRRSYVDAFLRGNNVMYISSDSDES